MAHASITRGAAAALLVLALVAGCGGDERPTDGASVDDTSPGTEATSPSGATSPTDAPDDADRSLPGMIPCEATGELTAGGEVISLAGATAGVQTGTSGPPAFYQVLVPDSDGTISLYSSGSGFTANVIVGIGEVSSGSDLDDSLDIRQDGSGVDVEVTTVAPVAGDPVATVHLRLTCS